MKHWCFLLMSLLWGAASQAAANPFVLETAYLVSSSNASRLEDVVALPASAFTAYQKDLRLGFVEQPVWIKLRISAQPNQSLETPSDFVSDSAVVLRVGLLSLDNITVFERLDGKWEKQNRGDKVKDKYTSCQDDFHCFELRSDPKQPIDIYLNVQTATITTVVMEAVAV